MWIITILTIPLMLAVTCESTKTQTRIYAQCHIARDVLCRKVEGVEKKQSANDRVNKAQDTSISKLQLHVNLLQTKNELFENKNEEFKEEIKLLEVKIEQLEEKDNQLEEKNKQLQIDVNIIQNQIAALLGYFNSSSCLQIYNSDHNASGIFQLNVFSKRINVYCEHEGWMLIQRRFDGSVDFYRDRNQYKAGFGSLNGEFYLGNDNIYYLTKDKPHHIRFDLQDWDGNNAYAEYDNFTISSEADNYRVTFDGFSYKGTAGDSFGEHNNMEFSTRDNDNDLHSSVNCAESLQGAWWFNTCFHSHINGLYFNSSQTPENSYRGVIWGDWKGWSYSLKAVSMKIKPMN